MAGPDKPWLMRTYAGHSSAASSNALYRENLSKGQTGLSVAFDLPTQTGYDSDHPLARGEVGKVGVPVRHIGDMEQLFDSIPLGEMNTSMTINATAPWLMALYIAVAERQGVERKALSGTVQNDIIKEYLARGTYVFPPRDSMRLTTDVISFAYREVPKWNPTNVCSYHLQEAGATPVQEIAFAMANAIAVLDTLKEGGQVPEEDFARVFGRVSFFVNAGIRFVTEMCKMRAFTDLWEELGRERYGVTEEKYLRFRYGVQVNSLGLTEQQPENNVYRILLEMLAVVLSKKARARAVQLPAWNEALGLPRPWDQQWSLRLQQIVAFETDLLEYEDLFDGNPAVEEKVETLKTEARAELARIEEMGGALAAIESAYMKTELVQSHAQRRAEVESGVLPVIGVNTYTENEGSPLVGGQDGGYLALDPSIEKDQIADLRRWRNDRDHKAVAEALGALQQAARDGSNVMEPSIACAHAGVTTGEWSDALRDVFGEYRAPTGVETADPSALLDDQQDWEDLKDRVADMSETFGRQICLLMTKPGLDGHSNGAEQIALRARAAGMDSHYVGIRQTPDEIVAAAKELRPHAIGISVLSGTHVTLASEILGLLRKQGLGSIPVFVGGIVPPSDAEILLGAGVAKVYTPKDFDIGKILEEIVTTIAVDAGGAPKSMVFAG